MTKQKIRDLTVFNLPAAAITQCYGILGLNERAAEHAFSPTLATQEASAGLVRPRAEDGELIELIGDFVVFDVQTESRKVPPSALQRRADELSAQVERDTGRRPGKAQRRDLKDQARLELLPHAFPRQKRTRVIIDRAAGRLMIGSVSGGVIDHVLSFVSRLIDTLQQEANGSLKPFAYGQGFMSPRGLLNAWLTDGEAGNGFGLGTACTIKRADETKGAISYKNMSLQREEIAAGLQAGMYVASADIERPNDLVSFSLSESGAIRRLEFDTPGADSDVSDDDAFGADIVLCGSALRAMLTALHDCLLQIDEAA
jgi:recombination associated protein RdgC